MLAGLNPAEVTVMVETIRHILVLNHGEVIASGAPLDVSQNPHVIEAYLGSPELAARLGEKA